jgi:deoxycytidine triphosphate deaminase
MLSREVLLSLLGENVIIHPFELAHMRGAAYNARVGDFVWLRPGANSPSGTQRSRIPIIPEVIESKGRVYRIPSGAMVYLLTKEVFYVDGSIAGLIHSKVDTVSKGFTHISTTLGPNWIGPLFVALQNVTSDTIPLWEGETILKVVLFRLPEPTMFQPNNQPGRPDRLEAEHLEFAIGDHDFLDKPVNCQLDVLRSEFYQSPEGRRLKDSRLSAAAKSSSLKWRVAKLSMSALILAGSVASPFWLPRLFNTKMEGGALAYLVGACLGAFYFFIKSVDDFRSRSG